MSDDPERSVRCTPKSIRSPCIVGNPLGRSLIITRQGIVMSYVMADQTTMLRAVAGGMLHTVIFPKIFKPKGLKRLATEFVESISS